MSSVSSRFMPATGSSSNSSLGSMASARPSSMRFWIPYGSMPTGRYRYGPSSIRSMISSTRRRFSISSRFARPHRTGQETGLHQVMPAEQEVVDHVQVHEEAQILERARDAEMGGRRRPHAHELAALEAN